MSQPQDQRFANTAGAPLPRLPRRTSSARPGITPSHSLPLPTGNSLSSFTTGSTLSSSSMTITTITPVTSPRNDSDLSSSSSSASDGTRPTIRTGRTRGVRNGDLRPPELSTPMPTLTAAPPSPKIVQKYDAPSQTENATASASQKAPSRPMLYTPGMPLRLSIESIKARKVSESHVSHSAPPSQSTSSLCESFPAERLIRKKSGQLVKSSLKSSRSASRNDPLSVFTLPQSSKSEPTTPTSKAVHFDSKLEHVKLFLAEQKPLAVSRDGSPTDDTSGTDSDFPRFIFDDGPEEDSRRPKKKLVMQVANMPAQINPNSDVALEELTLSADGTSILGKVRVRNVAFAKWVAVRFTFDSWQTTSEVTAKYMESVSTEFDRFAFSIRLNDLLARIEGKTLIVAVKYSVAGREVWDNNFGQNYLATFTKAKLPEEPWSSPTKTATISDDETDIADLKNKLEKVVQSKDRTGPAFLAQHVSRRPPPASVDADITSFRTSGSFASRYDFSASLKSSWNPEVTVPPAPLHSRTQSFPLSATKGNGSSIPWPQKGPSDPYALKRTPRHSHTSSLPTVPIPNVPQSKPAPLGSPRDLGDDLFSSAMRTPLEFEDVPFHIHQPRMARNHQRGYFDLSLPAGPASLKRTPPGTPRSPGEDAYVGSPKRFNSYPLSNSSSSFGSSPVLSSSLLQSTPMQSKIATPTTMQISPGDIDGDNEEDSELSTPSMVTPSSSRESSPSPTEMFMNMVYEENALSPDTHYRQFLNKFCFFTGPGSTINNAQPDAEHIPRTHSASDIEELLSGLSPRLQALANGTGPVSPTRSPSLDDLMLNRSGSLTPTISRLSFASANSQCGTPVLV